MIVIAVILLAGILVSLLVIVSLLVKTNRVLDQILEEVGDIETQMG